MSEAAASASSATRADDWTWPVISPMEVASSSEAEATVSTLADACSEAAATVVALSALSSAVADRDAAVVSSSDEAAATVFRIRLTSASKWAIVCSMAMARRSRASRSAACSASRRARSSPFSLKTRTASAMDPISSRRPTKGMGASSSPFARRRIAPSMLESGRLTPNRMVHSAKPTVPALAAPMPTMAQREVASAASAIAYSCSATLICSATSSPTGVPIGSMVG